MCGELDWRGLYTQKFDIWCKSSYSHPAKMAPDLCYKIIEHLEKMDLLNKKSIILDPLAGIGTTNICAGLKGYKTISVELESKFIELQKENKQYIERKAHKKLNWTIIQGDARNLVFLLKERELIAITSPPYAHPAKGEDISAEESQKGGSMGQSLRQPDGYSKNLKNIGNLPDKSLVCITSPPYSQAQSGSGIAKIDKQGKNQPDKVGEKGGTPGQISNLPDKNLIAITSPPLEKGWHASYGKAKEQIGRLYEETYLSAMLQVYSQLAQICNVVVVVIKDPTRDGKIRALGADTILLLKQAGFEIFDYHRSILFEEVQERDIFGNVIKKLKGRLSFFKRLQYQKGLPVSNFEHVFLAKYGGNKC